MPNRGEASHFDIPAATPVNPSGVVVHTNWVDARKKPIRHRQRRACLFEWK
jgi:hypothetical protein